MRFPFLKKSALAAFLVLVTVSCFEEQAPSSYYTFLDDNIASYLEKNSEDFSTFIDILKKARVWGELSTYGT